MITTADLVKVYNRLPAPFRHAAATARGVYLRGWRYGRETESLIAESQMRDAWNPDQWRTWQEERLARLLHRAATRVPYYRDQWAERRRAGDRAAWEVLANWQVLEKDALRDHPEAFIADDRDLRALFKEQTSGTTGKPLRLYWSKEAVRGWYAIYEARIRRWHGVSIQQPWAILGGQQVVPPGVDKPPYWVWNAALKQLYLSSNHLNPRTVGHYAAALTRYKITHIVAYSSSVTYLAQALLDAGIRPEAPIRLVATNAEPLYDWQRAAIAGAFNCPRAQTYGMGEAVAAGSEDTAGIHRLWADVGVVEVRDADADGVGELLCTGLLNADMPLIRYRVGDRGAIADPATVADTGSIRLPVIRRIEGRVSDMLIGPTGNRVWWVNPVFYGLPVREAQIVQETVDRFHIRYVAAGDADPAAEAAMRERLQTRLGGAVYVVVESVADIPRGANGKFRPVINQLSADDRARL